MGAIRHRKGRLRADDDLVPAALDRLAENFFGQPAGIHVGGVEHVQPRVQADIDEPRCAFGVRVTPSLEKIAAAAESAGAETENRDLEARTAKLSKFHVRR